MIAIILFLRPVMEKVEQIGEWEENGHDDPIQPFLLKKIYDFAIILNRRLGDGGEMNRSSGDG